MSEIKLDVNITRKQIEDMAKATIREIVGENIQEIMKSLDVKTIIQNKIKTMDGDFTKQINVAVKKYTDNMKWEVQRVVEDTSRKIVMEEIQKKPISDFKVYLNVCSSDNNY